MIDNSPPDLVARRQRYIERMKAQHADSVDVLPAGSETAEIREAQQPQGQGPANRHGMPKLPVGQRAVNNWPVLDLGDLPEVSTDEWRLEVGGLVENPVVLSWTDFLALPQTIDMSDFHCVTTWSRMDNNWEGVRFADLMELVVPKDEARVVFCTAYDKDARYRHPLHHQPAVGPGSVSRRAPRACLGRRPVAARARRAVPHHHPPAIRLEGRQVDPQDRASRRGPAGILGNTRLFEYRRALV